MQGRPFYQKCTFHIFFFAGGRCCAAQGIEILLPVLRFRDIHIKRAADILIPCITVDIPPCQNRDCPQLRSLLRCQSDGHLHDLLLLIVIDAGGVNALQKQHQLLTDNMTALG